MNKKIWIKLIEKHREKCENIISLSKDIRYAGVFNEYGRTIAGKIKPGIKPIFSPTAVREEYFAIASTMRLRKKSAKGLGELKYIIIHHKKINIVLFYQNNVTYYNTINSKVNLTSTLIHKIEKMIIC